MKNLKNIFVLSLLVSTLTGCWEMDAESNVIVNEQPPVVEAEAEPETETPEVPTTQIVETDDIGTPGNDIETVAISIEGTSLVVAQTHKAAKDAWHTIRVYLNTEDTDTITTPIASGAASLTGLVAEYGYVFEYTGAGWNISKKDVDGGVWIDAATITTATATGGDTELTTMTIPLSEIGDPATGTTVKMMFVGTGTGWGTDQAPNDAMYDYVVE